MGSSLVGSRVEPRWSAAPGEPGEGDLPHLLGMVGGEGRHVLEGQVVDEDAFPGGIRPLAVLQPAS
jgi:hypothetical protein